MAAAAPAAMGEDMLVPLNMLEPSELSGVDDSAEPGATTFGRISPV